MTDFKIGDKVVYTGGYSIHDTRFIGKTGVVEEVNNVMESCKVRWDDNPGGWPESATAFPFQENLRLVNEKPVSSEVRRYRQTIAGFKDARAEWIKILVAQPSNNTAAGHIMAINNKIEVLDTLRHLENDYEPVEASSV